MTIVSRALEVLLSRANVWRAIFLFIIAFWAAVIALAVPAIYANASTGPAHCRGLTADECTARAEGGW